MDWHARHADFVLASYAITALFLLGLTLYVVMRAHATRKKLQALERLPHE